MTANDLLVEGSPNPKIEEIFKQIPCAICQHSSSGIHFGATTCEVRTDGSFAVMINMSRFRPPGLQEFLPSDDERSRSSALQMLRTEQL